MNEPKTRVCVNCRIRQVSKNMVRVKNVWYCRNCAPPESSMEYSEIFR